jgi:hypothetical protein
MFCGFTLILTSSEGVAASSLLYSCHVLESTFSFSGFRNQVRLFGVPPNFLIVSDGAHAVLLLPYEFS